MKIGDIVKDKVTNQYCIIVDKYKSSGSFDWEIFALGYKFAYGHIWQDCRKEEKLIKTTQLHYVQYLLNKECTFWDKLKLLFKRLEK